MNRRLRLRRYLARAIYVNFILLVSALVWRAQSRPKGVELALAKGNQLLASNAVSPVQFEIEAVERVVLAHPILGARLRLGQSDFVSAQPLTAGEALRWRDAGCGEASCLHATLYDYQARGAVEAVINMDSKSIVASWANPLGRPAGSPAVLPRALAIAAAESRVQEVLGDLGAADPVMVPMSAWLADDACRSQWCVDLTFHDPEGTGRVFHVFVNLEEDRVARTFFTRARADIPAAMPEVQRDRFRDGCHDQYGWSICWEMTAHDGLDYRDARYGDSLVFTSAKLTQIEAWYPSWPGGYRDEIGFGGSVAPFGPTEVNDVGDAFEVRQLFTEFTRWPNCICCYRYEQIVRLFADGSFEFRFVSHGPGCDDLSVYRPFWRIDIDLDGPQNDSIWRWQETAWVEASREFEAHPLVDQISPDGSSLATFDGTLHYRWHLERTDPLGLDEARLFGLQEKEGEGDGPILTGPGDTFQPPRQWIDQEPLSGQDIVLWFVPILKTKKGDPYWCSPDPEPGLNQCEAILRAEPAAALEQPSLAELEAMREQPTVTPPPTRPKPIATPTPRPIGGEDAVTIMLNAGCGACHAIGGLGEPGKVGPDLTAIGLTAGDRVPGLEAADYLRQSILEPDTFIAPECPNGDCLAGIMPRDYGSRLSPAQLDIIIEALLSGTLVQPTPLAIGANSGQIARTPPAQVSALQKGIQRETPTTLSPANVAVQFFLVTLVFLLVLFRLWTRPPGGPADNADQG